MGSRVRTEVQFHRLFDMDGRPLSLRDYSTSRIPIQAHPITRYAMVAFSMFLLLSIVVLSYVAYSEWFDTTFSLGDLGALFFFLLSLKLTFFLLLMVVHLAPRMWGRDSLQVTRSGWQVCRFEEVVDEIDVLEVEYIGVRFSRGGLKDWFQWNIPQAPLYCVVVHLRDGTEIALANWLDRQTALALRSKLEGQRRALHRCTKWNAYRSPSRQPRSRRYVRGI